MHRLLLWAFNNFGFPDGHLTDYERAAQPYLLSFAITQLLLGIVSFWLISRPTQPKQKKLQQIFLGVSLGLTVLVVYVAIPWYYQTHLGLNHGQGG
jgi:hypothetical protein